MSAGVKMPLSPTMTRSFGTSGASRSLTASVVSKVRRSRLLMPISREARLQRALQFRLVMHLDQHIHAERRAPPPRCARASSSSTAAMMIRMQSAPSARASYDLVGLEEEILAQHRQVDRRARRDRDTPARPGRTARRSAPRGRPRRRP